MKYRIPAVALSLVLALGQDAGELRYRPERQIIPKPGRLESAFLRRI